MEKTLDLIAISDTIRSSLPPGAYFSLIVFSDKGYSYVTNTGTEKMVEVIELVAKKIKKQPKNGV